MEANFANHSVTYLVEVPINDTELLGDIRLWENVKGAFTHNALWIKNVTNEQLEHIAISGLPRKSIYYQKGSLLFRKDKLLPEKKLPEGLLWSPIYRLVTVDLPGLNHNYFGVSHSIIPKLIIDTKEKPTYAIMCNIEDARAYIEKAPAVRLEGLRYIGLNDKVFIIGKPILPIKGKAFWNSDRMLIPVGFDFEFSILNRIIYSKLNPENDSVIVWNTDQTYLRLSKADFADLTIGSFRLTYPKEV